MKTMWSVFIFAMIFLVEFSRADSRNEAGKQRSNQPNKVKWVDADKLPINEKGDKKDGKKKANFRDVIIEKIGEVIFERLGREMRGRKIAFGNNLNVQKTSSSYKISLSTENPTISGLESLRLPYFRVIRQFGLRNIQVQTQMECDLDVTGLYNLSGNALSLLPITGQGKFKIQLNQVKLSAVAYFKTAESDKEDPFGPGTLIIREPEANIDYDKVKFDFENMMGGGMVGSTVNIVMNDIGEVIIEDQRQQLVSLIKTQFRTFISNLL